MRILKRATLTFFALICLYLLLLTAAYAIPNNLIANNVNAALGLIQNEGQYPHYFFGYPFAQADNSTDNEMFLNLLKNDGDTVFQAAMVPRYARYWQGYTVLLRPLSIFLNLTNIRYLNMIALGLLLCLCFWKVAEQLNMAAAIAFLLSMLATFIWLAPFNIQYFIVTAQTLIFSLMLLMGYRRQRLMQNIAIIFLCFGSVTSFFDFLTFPILTLGYPLILLLLLRHRTNAGNTFRSEMLLLLACAASWCAGYGLTLLAKGALGTLITGTNVLEDIVKNALNRINGSIPQGYHEDASAWLSLRINFTAFFNARNLSMFILSVAGYVFLALRRKSSPQAWTVSLPLLGVAVFPYVWYCVLQNHSIMHMYFTYKAQAVTFFAICAYFIAVRGFATQQRDDAQSV